MATDARVALESRVERLPWSGCWLWTGSISSEGYGRLRHDGRYCKTHRLSYEAYKGPIGDGMCVCHICDVTHCVNPDHLFLGTVAENNADRSRKGRYLGEWNGRHKLTAPQIIDIRRRVVEGVAKRALAREYGISPVTVREIVLKKIWRHL